VPDSKNLTPSPFVLRRNADGSFDSICLNCYMTVAKAKNEGELRETEMFHYCQ
jgi:hypothetical protein